MEGFEVLPHWVRGIGEPAVRECIGQEQITELIVHAGLGNRIDRQHGQSSAKSQKQNNQNGEAPASG